MNTQSKSLVPSAVGCALCLFAWWFMAGVTPAAEKTTTRPKTKPSADEKGARETTFDDIKLDLAKDQPFDRAILTPEVEALHNKRIRIRGYILPTFQQSGIKQFVLVRDNMECCFGPGAALYDCIWVSMKEGRTTDFSTRPVAVEGTFRIEDFLDPDGKQLAIYQMEGEKVE